MAGETIYLELSDEQRLLTRTAQRALSGRDTLSAARAGLDGMPGEDLWSVAVEAGWAGLLSAESVEGAGLGADEALLVLELCGSRLADAHLLGHLPASWLIEAAGADVGEELRTALALGDRRAALVDLALAPRRATLARGEDGRLSGHVPGVLDAPGAEVFVVVVDDRAELVEATAGGVSVAPESAYDATRSLGTVGFEDVAGTELHTDPAPGRDLQRALLGAEAVGAAQACLEMARDYAAYREAFGRKIGSYQALKHKLVEMLRKVENGRSLMVAAARAAQTDGFTLAANALSVVGSDALDYAAAENIFVHGGIGATWDHDAQLYYRRAEVSRRLAGGSEAAARAVADALLAAV